MTDYLALIAEKTVRCGACNGRGFRLEGVDLKTPMPDCDVCDSGRVLDPRFDGLREDCPGPFSIGVIRCPVRFPKDYSSPEVIEADPCKGTGYTVVRDLTVLLVCITAFGEEAAQDAAAAGRRS